MYTFVYLQGRLSLPSCSCMFHVHACICSMLLSTSGAPANISHARQCTCYWSACLFYFSVGRYADFYRKEHVYKLLHKETLLHIILCGETVQQVKIKPEGGGQGWTFTCIIFTAVKWFECMCSTAYIYGLVLALYVQHWSVYMYLGVWYNFQWQSNKKWLAIFWQVEHVTSKGREIKSRC